MLYYQSWKERASFRDINQNYEGSPSNLEKSLVCKQRKCHAKLINTFAPVYFALRSGPKIHFLILCIFLHLPFTVQFIVSFFAATLSGLRGLAETQSWLLHKRVSSGCGGAGEGGEDAKSQATGKNGLIRAVQYLRPQSNAAALLTFL